MKLLYMTKECTAVDAYHEMYRKRVLNYCIKAGISYLFISASADDAEDDFAADAFEQACAEAHISVIHAGTQLEVAGQRINLSDTALSIEDVGHWKVCNEAPIFIDTESGVSYPVYMYLFLNHAYAIRKERLDFERMEDELSELLRDLLRSHKKTNQEH